MEQVEKLGHLLSSGGKRYMHIRRVKEIEFVLNDKNRYWSTANL